MERIFQCTDNKVNNYSQVLGTLSVKEITFALYLFYGHKWILLLVPNNTVIILFDIFYLLHYKILCLSFFNNQNKAVTKMRSAGYQVICFIYFSLLN